MQQWSTLVKHLRPDFLEGSRTAVWPGPQVITEAEMKTLIDVKAWGHHAICTCPIGAHNNPIAVWTPA
jgi:choline dehydrogenase